MALNIEASAELGGAVAQLKPDPLGGSAIDFLAVADLDNIHEQFRIVYGVYDPVAALADAVSVSLGG